jgi:hypothetical protein
MRKIKLVTMGFVNADILAHSMEHVYKIKSDQLEYEHYFVDQHYPINRESNVLKLKKVCEKYGIKWIDALYDRGLHHGLNFWMDECKVNDELFIGLDPDSWPNERGCDEALVDCMEIKSSNLAFCTLNNSINIARQDLLLAPVVLGKHLCMLPTNRPTMFNIVCWRASWLRSIGGFHQPTSHWGHLETYLWKKLVDTKHCFAILVDHRETERPWHMPGHDALYVQYKAEQGAFKTRLGLNEWLKQRNPSQPG